MLTSVHSHNPDALRRLVRAESKVFGLPRIMSGARVFARSLRSLASVYATDQSKDCCHSPLPWSGSLACGSLAAVSASPSSFCFSPCLRRGRAPSQGDEDCCIKQLFVSYWGFCFTVAFNWVSRSCVTRRTLTGQSPFIRG